MSYASGMAIGLTIGQQLLKFFLKMEEIIKLLVFQNYIKD